ncbi:uncharacterized protein LOC111624752 [Centruroides sculpturatus]|uniref:uncharacterized protein LOC111624752 n=1 Tax=Centruroides sculpturatus TaxID=218467 RepID=UPI000C6ED0A8|nr:uncharacterized protein LOC111624752 [Centruroides sculpturatus]
MKMDKSLNIMKTLLKGMKLCIPCLTKENKCNSFNNETEFRMAFYLKQFKKWTPNTGNRSFDYQEKRKTIRYLSEICFKWNIQEKNTILELLHQLFKHDIYFYNLFTNVSTVLQFKNDPNENGKYEHLNYFLLQTNRLRVTFGDENLRIADIAFYIKYRSRNPKFCLGAILNCDPTLLLLLLQHGALIKWMLTTRQCNINHNDYKYLIYLILLLWREKRFGYDNVELVNVKKTSGILPELISNANLLLRAVPKLRNACGIRDTEKYKHNFQYEKIIVPHILDKFHKLLPSLIERYLKPAKLQHLCRCVIRYRLWLNWKLPRGIELLPLPTFLKNYINLLID